MALDASTPLRQVTTINSDAMYDSLPQISQRRRVESFATSEDQHRTTFFDTLVHLIKGYIGPGCLSLPWALSQLGVVPGCFALAIISFWTSYNCWTVVKIKRYIERTQLAQADAEEAASEVASTTATSVTYPDVGDWAYGRSFQKYVTICVCTQQLAICTVFLSFIGENILAVLLLLDVPLFSTHVGVISMALPFALGLSFLPDLKKLAPVMVGGTAFLLLTFATLAVIVGLEWHNRPETPNFHLAQSPLAICALLYSFEGINLILPIESAMKEPQEFKFVFIISMIVVTCVLGAVACSMVYTFGEVTNGSVTAFLLEHYRGDTDITMWLMAANAFVSVSVLLTYPLQLFPTLELIGPWVSGKLGLLRKEDSENDLVGFEAMPPVPEHETYKHESDDDDHLQLHRYEDDLDGKVAANDNDDTLREDQSRVSISSVTNPVPTGTAAIPGDSLLLRASLVFVTFIIAVAIPNVQALISLAGAVAGSSTALLIPPILELAWIQHLEEKNSQSSPDSFAREDRSWISVSNKGSGKWRFEKLKCGFLLSLGVIFAIIGTCASVADIVRIYIGD